MSEPATESAAPPPTSAGRLLREAREKQGLHIAALAAAIKVSPKKLELLEADRFDQLPDATFIRALAQTVCRALKTDPSAVMRLLPPPVGHRLEHVGGGLNAPFRDRPGALVQRDWFQFAGNPFFWIVALILVATAGVYLLPASVTSLAMGRSPAASAPAARGAVEPGMPPETVESAVPASATASMPVSAPSLAPAGTMLAPETTASPAAAPQSLPQASLVATASAAASVAAAAALPMPMPMPMAPATLVAATVDSAGVLPPGMLQLRASSATWVEVTDGRGKPLVSRLVRSGEAIGVDGVPPLKVRIGNAAGTKLVFRGQPTELQAFTRDNVARLELK
jgi:cytoskeleton protein RodZ